MVLSLFLVILGTTLTSLLALMRVISSLTLTASQMASHWWWQCNSQLLWFWSCYKEQIMLTIHINKWILCFNNINNNTLDYFFNAFPLINIMTLKAIIILRTSEHAITREWNIEIAQTPIIPKPFGTLTIQTTHLWNMCSVYRKENKETVEMHLYGKSIIHSETCYTSK